MPRTSPRKKQSVSYKEEPDAETPGKPNGLYKSVDKFKGAVSKASTRLVGKRKAEDDKGEGEAPKAPKKRKTKAAKADEPTMPLAERTPIASLKKAMYLGAHVSAAGGVQNSVTNAVHIGANSFALFLKSQRKWDNPPITSESQDLFFSNCKEHGYEAAQHALPHGSYLVNLAQPDKEKAAQAYKGFLDDLQRCEQLGIKLYNFHPGSTGGEPRSEALTRIATQLNKSHKETGSVVTVLENMAGAGNVIGSKWEDLRDIIAQVEDKSRVGVCIDTCHAFAAGHDLRTPEAFKATVDAFDQIVGMKYLKAFHLNDSKAPFNSNRDLHANIGTGFLGLRAFHSLMNHDAFHHMPMVLETPIDRKGPDGKNIEDKQVWADEIKLLESLIGMDPESDGFKEKEKQLQVKGAAERSRIQEQVDKKSTKDAKAAAKGAGRKKKKAAASDDESE